MVLPRRPLIFDRRLRPGACAPSWTTAQPGGAASCCGTAVSPAAACPKALAEVADLAGEAAYQAAHRPLAVPVPPGPGQGPGRGRRRPGARWCSTGARAPAETDASLSDHRVEAGARPAARDQVTRAHVVVLSSLAMSVWRANDMDATMTWPPRGAGRARGRRGPAGGRLVHAPGSARGFRARTTTVTTSGGTWPWPRHWCPTSIALRAYVNISDVLGASAGPGGGSVAERWCWPTGFGPPRSWCLPRRKPTEKACSTWPLDRGRAGSPPRR